ncbi:MAG: AMP-binding protein [Prosthecobacter sp.]|uniref:AMP-binding protein n=1 Tax=Prosthecobacter sp. TaxID=1965333 RepID=UPI00390308A3
MATAHLISSGFWNDAGNHIALPSERGHEAAGLEKFAQDELGAAGWCFFQTSGSEGRQKWVGLAKAAMLTSARAVNAHFDVTQRDHWLLALPIHHVGGFGILARAFVSGSAVTRMEGKWDAAAFARRCGEVGATLASLVPTQVFDLVAAKLSAPKSLRVVLVGGGAMSRELEEAARTLGWPVCRTYGMTETASQVAAQAMNGHGEMEVLPIWDVRTDDEGVLTVRGEALAKGYAVLEAGTWRWEPISTGTGLSTRDRVSLWTHGTQRFLRFSGRETNTVKILGELVALEPIQERIEALRLKLGLREGAAVICDVPDERKEARLVLVSTGVGTVDAERLREALNRELRPFEQVEQIICLPTIPRSELDKVRLAELRALL